MRTKLAITAVSLLMVLALMPLLHVRGETPASAADPAQPTPAKAELGINAPLNGAKIFPADDPWNTDISAVPVDPNSAALVESMGLTKPLHPDFGAPHNGVPAGIPYIVIAGNQPRVKVMFDYKDESDPGPYPVPPDAPVEGGLKSDGDRHVLILDRDNAMLYELFAAFPQEDGKWWKAGSGAVFDLKKISYGQRPMGWTSADAAGLPVFPGLVKYEEVAERKEIRHAIRFTAVNTRHAYVAPATHYASNKTSSNLPPMGMHVRLKANYDISHFPPHCQVILEALKKYGMILADNGSDWFISGSPDDHWDDDELHQLTKVKGADFEVVQMGEVTTR